MDKVSLYVKKILALMVAAIIFIWASRLSFIDTQFESILILAGAFLLFAFLDFRITGEKPRFLFGLSQSDAYLNKRGGFWNLFKWIVNLLGLAYDLVVWALWGVYLLFILFAELLLFIKTIVFWIIYAIIWFIRQLFPPFVFLFKMVLYYMVYWPWWIYQVAFRNMKISVNKNFYFIALWGTVPALFIVFLFYAIGQLTGIPELVVVSALFAIIPLVWSYGEIAALRFEQRERDDYTAVRIGYRSGFDAVRSVLFYLLIIMVLIVAMIVLNMLGWIPNLSMSFLGIALNINMAISLLLIFLAVILFFAVSVLPTHILYRPEHENDLRSSLALLQVIGRRFLRYSFASLPASLFGTLLLVIPVLVMLLAFTITEEVKDKILQVRIEQLSEKSAGMEAPDAYSADVQIKRLQKYQEVPLMAPVYFEELRNSSQPEVVQRESEVVQKETEVDQKELRRVRVQMPVLYLFVGIMFAIFGGLVVAVLVSYLGNVWYELYNLREDDKPTRWCQEIREIRERDANQPLLGFTFLAILGVLLFLGLYIL